MSRRQRRDLRGVFKPTGAVVIGLGVAIALCAAVGGAFDALTPRVGGPRGGVLPLGLAAIVTVGCGIPLFLYGRRHSTPNVTRRQAVLSVGLIWLAAGIFGALPFIFARTLGPIDAFFESVSGLTTTGATVVTDIEGTMARPVLLWRSLIQWLGGMGIVVLFVAVFPTMGAGGKHMFKGEVPGTTAEGLKPRIAETSFALWKLYALFTLLETLVLLAIPSDPSRGVLGMDLFESICHAFTTMSTGGFSTRDASVGAYANPGIEYTIAIFMLIGSANYGLYYAALRGRDLRVIWRSFEFRVYVGIVLASTLIMTAGNFILHEYDALLSFRKSLFMVATTISSTGYGTDDYTAYASPIFGLMLLLMFVGGCSGSTAGGIKIERAILLAKQTWSQIRKSFRPSVVEVIKMDRRTVPAQVLADVAAFTFIYFGCLAVGVITIAIADGVPIETSFGAMLTSLSNMGPGPYHLGADNFAAYSGFSKLFFSVAMLLGRLEFFTLFALLVGDFWRR
ncbi:MAG: hypothetical protein OEY14_11185 [Myxococcales bacterium]|nr:hypothetical protein [Myxococcales bacterium]